ncbi:TlpA disulfide reductase family protein [Rhizosphaericola mali]|uniref:AhpC/TSA family protein n=1 Tax=Rhizosphaericola mali TaxID=2545455 RepID=A0A5P2GC63_9BACT|nr:TlpA disulfide reductase family protein [Rhizosphaericola mali]QES90803.1 AhpC/TSA family protein [Rhizosphaericola mali]
MRQYLIRIKIITILIFLTCITNNINAKQICYIKGRIIKRYDNKFIYLFGIDYSSLNKRIIDSTRIHNGKFSFTEKLHTPGLLTTLYIRDGHSKIPPTSIQLMLNPGKINIKITDSVWYEWENPNAVKIKNAHINEQWKKWENIIPFTETKSYLSYKIDSLKKAFPDSNFAYMYHVKDSLAGEEIRKQKQYILNHPNEYFSLYAVSYFMGDWKHDSTGLYLMYESLSPNLKRLPEGLKLKEKFYKITKLINGAFAPDFAIPDTSGKIVKLSEFKGHYVLLDFWASWCIPCISQIPELKNFAEKNKNKGLKIVSISLDNNRIAWLKGIKKFGLTWINVSDIKEWKSKIVDDYYINSIPHAILIDKNGKILEMNVDFSKNYF